MEENGSVSRSAVGSMEECEGGPGELRCFLSTPVFTVS